MVLKVSYILQLSHRCYSMKCVMKETIFAGNKSTGNIFNLTSDLENCVSIAAKHIKQENVIALPTDTIYGIAASAGSSKAINKLYRIKSREFSKPLAICVSEVSKMSRWGKIEHLPKEMLHELLPGPVTVIVDRTNHLNPKLNPGIRKVGIRIPNNEFILKLTSALDVPLALTSANVSNKTSTVTVDEFSVLWSHLSAIFDGGKIGNNRCGSTIVDLSNPGKYEIIRKGNCFETTLQVLHKYNYSIF